MLRASLALLVLVGCSKPDACELAVSKLERMAEKQAQGQPWKRSKHALEACRSVGKADPVLRCALEEKTDEATSECIERVLAGVIKENSGEQGSGLNPLLEE